MYTKTLKNKIINLNSFYPILFNILDVLIIILPILLAVAFMTIIERKQLAAMQRRVGPNTVGYQLNLSLRRFYHSSFKNYEEYTIKNLYKKRKALVLPFMDEILFTCTDLIVLNKDLKFKEFKDKGGIYMFKYKFDFYIYYIGRTNNFYKRIKVHLNTKLNDKFHKFANTLGWDNFEFSIIEICDQTKQQERENYY